MKSAGDKELLKQFGTHLKTLRVERNLSLRELAAITGLEYSHINKIENGNNNPTYTVLQILADGLEITISELVTIPESPAKSRAKK